ncbi:putative metallophosphoesterase [Mycoplasmopsis californica]|uniref:YmdB family metallophosphoesterase n=1 Tax=Mycoplasmopsis equigenitalium TaxID=114883 RepID=A0ABY5J2T6_9BACT|nr:TIGR00282 family metallophosphoesterase [Mycoplasmopsis equigenitalium]UUD37083.1 YmdB family metallophosphoesterase [Mycoplasmopsis equigenitalium]VEU69616.1 putative metallophosphoesterase [Mycoplasmopsis californica]
MNKKLNVLFLGDIFGLPGIEAVERALPELIKTHKIDFVIAQAENVSGRKGFVKSDYLRLKKAGINVFTLGNHVWAKKEILAIIENADIVRPANVDIKYPGLGSRVFVIDDKKIRISSLMGITFNKLSTPWEEEYANSFFDAADALIENDKTDFHIIDFHGETTSEKNVFALYVDGKVSAVLGTHTHVQTNDERRLPNGTLFISDAGMCGPQNAAIGANFDEVYQHMRYGSHVKFQVSKNKPQVNGVVLNLSTNKSNNKIKKIKIL